MKRTLVFASSVVSSALCAALLAAPAAAALPKQVGKAEGQVNIIAWPGYIERGASDKAYDWVTQFETDSGCKVDDAEVIQSLDRHVPSIAEAVRGGFVRRTKALELRL